MTEMDQNFWNEAYQQDPQQVLVKDWVLDQEIEGLKVGTVLDLGCGTGHNALKLAQRGWKVVGVDWAESAINQANQIAEEKGLAANFHVGNITEWEPADKFDLIISTYALPEGDQKKHTLNTMQTWLKGGGTAIVVEWDAAMNKVWGWGDTLLAAAEIAALLPELIIDKAEVRYLENVFGSTLTQTDDVRAQAGQSAHVAIVRGRKP